MKGERKGRGEGGTEGTLTATQALETDQKETWKEMAG